MENGFHLPCENFAYLYKIKLIPTYVRNENTSNTYFTKSVFIVNTIQEKNYTKFSSKIRQDVG